LVSPNRTGSTIPVNPTAVRQAFPFGLAQLEVDEPVSQTLQGKDGRRTAHEPGPIPGLPRESKSVRREMTNLYDKFEPNPQIRDLVTL